MRTTSEITTGQMIWSANKPYIYFVCRPQFIERRQRLPSPFVHSRQRTLFIRSNRFIYKSIRRFLRIFTEIFIDSFFSPICDYQRQSTFVAGINRWVSDFDVRNNFLQAILNDLFFEIKKQNFLTLEKSVPSQVLLRNN